MKTGIMWFRRDLRLADHPALLAAIGYGDVIPVYCWTPADEGEWAPGAASRWWLHHSLAALNAALEKRGSRLIILQADSAAAALTELVATSGATRVFASRVAEPDFLAQEDAVGAALAGHGVELSVFNASMLFDPAEIRTQQGDPYKVFTPFWKTCCAVQAPDAPLRAPLQIALPRQTPASLDLADLGLLPTIPWDAGFREMWTPGERGAKRALREFLSDAVRRYPDERDRPCVHGTSRLSAALHIGELGPRQIWHAALHAEQVSSVSALPPHMTAFVRQIVWREFSIHLLIYFPATTHKPLREQFEVFPWRDDPVALKAWQQGRTGYPIVDAGMRELWATGWMHNRVRMIVGSFLVKHLMLHWRHGAAWFWDTLVDADLPNNTMGWQWIAGCGADAAPYFRVFNPVLQGKRFESTGDYVRRWVPELASLPDRWIHAPWEAPSAAMKGIDYPAPIVELKAGRDRALDAYRELVAATR